MGTAAGLGAGLGIGGLILSYWYDLPPGATIVVVAIVLYAALALIRPLIVRRKAASHQ
jgi:zinc transport system permease protein